MARHKIAIALGMIVIVLINGTCRTTDPTGSATNSCQYDSDCTLAIDVGVCCSCPEVMSSSQVQSTKGLEIYIPGNNYGELRPSICSSVDCAACPLPPAGAICQTGICQAPESVDQILSLCPNCFPQAAQAAYKANNLGEAIEYCSISNIEIQFICFSQIFDSALQKNHIDEAEVICLQFLRQDIGSCVRPLALRIVEQDEKHAIGLCNEMDPNDARHFGCMLDLALAMKLRSPDIAQWICEQLEEEEAFLCFREVSR